MVAKVKVTVIWLMTISINMINMANSLRHSTWIIHRKMPAAFLKLTEDNIKLNDKQTS